MSEVRSLYLPPSKSAHHSARSASSGSRESTEIHIIVTIPIAPAPCNWFVQIMRIRQPGASMSAEAGPGRPIAPGTRVGQGPRGCDDREFRFRSLRATVGLVLRLGCRKGVSYGESRGFRAA